MRWPSKNLTDLLRQLRLCSRADVEACEPIVRRLCHDLPDFDTVWLDALVQQRKITPWQALQLQSRHPTDIVVDDVQLNDALGQSTFAGADRLGPVAVRKLSGRDQQSIGRQNDVLQRTLANIGHTRATAPLSICLPVRLTENANHDIHLISQLVSGWTAEELIVRGGRLPWRAVAEIGRQLLDAMQWLETQSLTHGEIVLRNIKVAPDGVATLVAPFVQQLEQPAVSITSAQTLKHVETSAPELVGTGRSADSRSELYALGCVLWQLLTSRPPFPSADPVGRLQQGQLHEIPGIRELVPDCPDWLASQISSLTRRSLELRPSSVEAAAAEWNSKAPTGTTATRRLLKRLPDRSQRRQTTAIQTRSARRLFPRVAAVVVMVPLFCLYAWNRGIMPGTLEMNRTNSATPTNAVPTNSAATEQSPVQTSRMLTLPAPDAAGVVLLRSGKEYHSANLQFAGVMHIETDEDALATVHVSTAAWQLRASQVHLTNVLIDVDESRGPAPANSLLIRSEVFSIRDCIVEHQAGSPDGSAVLWTSPGITAGVVAAKNCIFRGEGYGLWLQGTPSRLELDNVLFQQQAGGIRCDASRSGLQLNLSKVTQVGGNAFLDLIPHDGIDTDLLVQMQCGESVLAPSAGLIRIAGPESLSALNCQVEFLLPERGNATIIPPDVDPVLWFDRSLKQFVRINQSQVVSESLLIARPVFRGSADRTTAGSAEHFELLDYEGPKLNAEMPGISLSELPVILEELSN